MARKCDFNNMFEMYESDPVTGRERTAPRFGQVWLNCEHPTGMEMVPKVN